MAKRRRFTSEFKAEVVLEVAPPEETPKQKHLASGGKKCHSGSCLYICIFTHSSLSL